MNPPINGIKITSNPRLNGSGITIGSTIVHIIGNGILIKGCPSIGFTKGAIGIIAGGKYPTGQYLNPNLTEGPLARKNEISSTGGRPLGYGSNPRSVAFLLNSFHQHFWYIVGQSDEFDGD